MTETASHKAVLERDARIDRLERALACLTEQLHEIIAAREWTDADAKIKAKLEPAIAAPQRGKP